MFWSLEYLYWLAAKLWPDAAVVAGASQQEVQGPRGLRPQNLPRPVKKWFLSFQWRFVEQSSI